MNCQRCHDELATLLLDSRANASANPAAAAVQAHLQDCATCAAEFDSLRATLSLMDEWTAPAPSPFFDTRLHARLREEIAAEPAGLWERVRMRWSLNTHLQLRHAGIAALAVLLVAGGSSYVGFNALHPAKPQVSAAVQDLQSLDKNDQTIAAMDQLLDDGSIADPGNQDNSQVNP